MEEPQEEQFMEYTDAQLMTLSSGGQINKNNKPSQAPER